MKQRRFLGLIASMGLLTVLAAGCISDETRGWAAPTFEDDTQITTTSRGRLEGLDARPEPSPAWTGRLTAPLTDTNDRLRSDAVGATETVFQGDILRIGGEVVRVRSLTLVNGAREMHLDRGYAGTAAMSHPAGAEIEAFRRPWRFPDDWDIRQSNARRLGGIYGQPLVAADGVVFLGDYNGWVYAFRPSEVNRDARDASDEPKVAVSNLRNRIVGGVTLDEDNARLYAAAGPNVYLVSTDRLRAALAAGGGEVDPEPGFFFEAADNVWTRPVLADGLLLVAGLDSGLYALDPESGAVQWTFRAGAGLMTTPVIVEDLVLVAGFGSTLHAVNINSGEEAWRFQASNWIFSSPVVEDGVAYFGDFDGIMHAVDVSTGEEQWSLPLNRGEIRAAAAVAGDILVAGTDDGWLLGMSLDQPQQLWAVELGTALHADLVEQDGRVLLAPNGCVTLGDNGSRVYYRAVNPENGQLIQATGVC